MMHYRARTPSRSHLRGPNDLLYFHYAYKMVFHHNTYKHVRLLSPCFKTGCWLSFHQHLCTRFRWTDPADLQQVNKALQLPTVLRRCRNAAKHVTPHYCTWRKFRFLTQERQNGSGVRYQYSIQGYETPAHRTTYTGLFLDSQAMLIGQQTR